MRFSSFLLPSLASAAAVEYQRGQIPGLSFKFDPSKFNFDPKKFDLSAFKPTQAIANSSTAGVQKPLSPAEIALQGILRNPGMLAAFSKPHQAEPAFKPREEILTPVLRKDAVRKKFYYGPYNLPSSKAVNFASVVYGDSGMIQIFKKITPPCSDCTILTGQAGLEFANGSEANTDMGGWLHHSILMAMGKDKAFAGCGRDTPMPGVDAFFGGGNERLLVKYTNSDASYNSGYYIAPNDTFTAYFELMNMDVDPKTVLPTITFEYIPGRPKGLKHIQDVWIDLDYCSPTGTEPLNDSFFTINSTKWTSPYDGTIVNVDGHLHDGGTHLRVYQNGALLCDAAASYGETPGFVERSNGIQGEAGMKHISHMNSCEAMGPIKKGDVFHVQAEYDFKTHMGERNNRGKLGEVMGLTVFFVALDD
jgi:hypothetical protein